MFKSKNPAAVQTSCMAWLYVLLSWKRKEKRLDLGKILGSLQNKNCLFMEV